MILCGDFKENKARNARRVGAAMLSITIEMVGSDIGKALRRAAPAFSFNYC